MIETSADFLPFFFQEPIYLISENPSETVYQPLGKNRSKILVLVEEPDAPHLSEPGKVLLEKILIAVNLSFEDIHLVNVSNCETPDNLEAELEFKTCITFGMPPEPWQYSNFSRKYEVIEDEKGRAFLWSDPLSSIASDVEKKKLLWLSLKSLFQTE